VPDGKSADPKGTVIKGADTEDKSLHEGIVNYDIRFHAVAPKTGKKVELIVNVEAQNDFYPGYPLIKRCLYYCCRMISSQYGKIIINKIDSETKKPLKGVEFEIRNSAGELVGDHPVADGVTTGSSSTGQISSNGKMTTGSQGHITLNSVKPDTYTITEIATIPRYILDSTPRSVIVEPGDTQTITIGNSPKGSLTVRKIDSVTKEPLAGVKFKIVMSNGELITGAGGATGSNGIYATDNNGEIVLTKLQPGAYSVTETENIESYEMDAQPHSVLVSANSAQTLGSVHIRGNMIK